MKFLKVKEVAQLLRVADITIYKWVENNAIPHHKINNTIRFDENEIMQWISEKRAK